VADGGGLENRYGARVSSWVRIPHPPLSGTKALQGAAAGWMGPESGRQLEQDQNARSRSGLFDVRGDVPAGFTNAIVAAGTQQRSFKFRNVWAFSLPGALSTVCDHAERR
jgi:hypothetical protein